MRAWGYEGGGRGARRETPYSREGESADACTVFVGNLPFEVTWRELKQHMAAAGEVAFADVKSGPDGRSKGVGIVRYATEAEALNAIETLSETDLGGREIFVRADRGSGGGGAGGRGLRGGRGGKGGKGGKNGKGGRDKPMSASDLDNDLDSYMAVGGGGDEEDAPAGGKKGPAARRGKAEPPTGAGLDDDLDAYFAAKKGDAAPAPAAATESTPAAE